MATPALFIETRRVRDVTVVKCAGRRAEGADCRALQHTIEHVTPRAMIPNVPEFVISMDFENRVITVRRWEGLVG